MKKIISIILLGFSLLQLLILVADNKEISRVCSNGVCISSCATQSTCPPCPPCKNCIPTCILSGSFVAIGDNAGNASFISQSGSNFIVSITNAVATVTFSPFDTIVAPTVSCSIISIPFSGPRLVGAPTNKSFSFTLDYYATDGPVTYYFVVTPAT